MATVRKPGGRRRELERPSLASADKAKRGRKLFTSKKYSLKSLISDCIGTVTFVSAAAGLAAAYRAGGQATVSVGAGFFVSLVLALAGFVLAVLGRQDPDTYASHARIGMLLNGLVIVLGAVVVYLGTL
ncbi:MAG: hypothetical protein II759_01680 [Lachnospiraceae bacterium]|nr:hypothetical protein [Lachnospiraceae bacterium]